MTLRWIALWIVCCVGTSAQAAAVDHKSLASQSDRSYYLYVPESAHADEPAPLLVLLHGSGGSAERMVQQWTSLAEEHGLVLVGPESKDPLRWQLRDDPATIFRDLIGHIAVAQPIDTTRIYLFGHSGGAVYALTLSMLQSRFFAATAIHAGAWREREEFKVSKLAARKIPLMFFIGNRDQYFSVDSVRQTASHLRKAGHEVSLSIIPRHDHDYGEIAESVNAQAWYFLHSQSLSESAIFQLYE
jgi:poly(3-hydroxybutyrate) depolymerase